MKTSFLSIVLLSGMCATISFAKSPLDRFSKEQLQKIAKSQMQKKVKMRAKSAQCTNFSGKWRGSCLNTDGSVDMENISIEQDGCYSITLGTHQNPVFGIVSEHKTVYPYGDDFDFNYSVAGSFLWNDSQTELTSLFSMNFGEFAIITSNRMWLENDTLRTQVLEDKMINLSDLNFVSSRLGCQYNRVP